MSDTGVYSRLDVLKPKIGISKNKRLSPFHLHEITDCQSSAHFCRDPYCVNPQRHSLSNITHSLRRPRAPVTDVHSRTRSTDTAQSQCMAAICMWVDPTLPRTAEGMSFRPHPASLNSARPRELRPTSNLLPHPNWISYLGLWRKDKAMI